jgi:HK97 family phage major capsid protein
MKGVFTMAMITDSDIQALITPEVRNEVIEDIIRQSAVLKHFSRLPNMTTSQRELKILDTLPVTYWVEGNTGFKKTTNLEWENKRIIAQELAVIVPVGINSVRDSAVDVWPTIRRTVVENMHEKIDEAIIMGKDKPPMFRASLVDSIINAGASLPTTTNFYNDTDVAMAKVEACGYIPNAIMGGVGLRSDLRRVLDSTGQPIYASWLEGLEKIYVDNSSWDPAKAKYIVGDFKKCVYSIRQDIEFEIFTQGVVNDPATGAVVYNLMQQDMIACRCTMRIGWEIPNPVNILQPNPILRFPLAMIYVPPAVTMYDVTFTVKDTAAAVIEGAKIKLGSLEQLTNAAGKAVFKLQGNSKVNYIVTAEGKSPVKGKTAVDAAAVAVNVVMN